MRLRSSVESNWGDNFIHLAVNIEWLYSLIITTPDKSPTTLSEVVNNANLETSISNEESSGVGSLSLVFSS